MVHMLAGDAILRMIKEARGDFHMATWSQIPATKEIVHRRRSALLSSLDALVEAGCPSSSASSAAAHEQRHGRLADRLRRVQRDLAATQAALLILALPEIEELTFVTRKHLTPRHLAIVKGRVLNLDNLAMPTTSLLDVLALLSCCFDLPSDKRRYTVFAGETISKTLVSFILRNVIARKLYGRLPKMIARSGIASDVSYMHL